MKVALAPVSKICHNFHVETNISRPFINKIYTVLFAEYGGRLLMYSCMIISISCKHSGRRNQLTCADLNRRDQFRHKRSAVVVTTNLYERVHITQFLLPLRKKLVNTSIM